MAAPTEIVDHILGFLHSDGNYTDLETCSYIFPQLVERHLYSQITFRTEPSLDIPRDPCYYIVDSTRFSRTLIDRPHIANYVRSVSIILGIRCPLAPELAAISFNLSNLCRIKSIVISSDHRCSWISLSYGFRTALQTSIRLPSIKEVAISGIYSFPFDIFDNCKNLERLQLGGGSDASAAGAGAGDVVSTSPYPRLHSLIVGTQNDMTMTRIVSWTRSNTLHSLSLHFDYMDLPLFRTLIEACSAALVNLELTPRCYVDCREFFAHRSYPVLQLPVLDQVLIRSVVDLDPTSRLPKSAIPPLIPFLSSICSLSPIHLCLHFRLYIGTGTQLLDLDWSDLAVFFLLPVFRHPIELCIDQVFGSASLADIVSSFKQNSNLKRLHETGELVIK